MCDGMWTRCPSAGWRCREPVGGPRRPSRGPATPRRRGCTGAGRAGGPGAAFSTASRVATTSVGPRLRLAVGRPQVPRPQVHQRLGVQGADVARPPGTAPTPPASPRRTPRRAACGRPGRVGVPGGQRLDQRPVRGRGRRRLRAGALRATPTPAFARSAGRSGLLIVRPAGERDAPVGHGAVGVEGGGVPERPDRLVVVEREQEGSPWSKYFCASGLAVATLRVCLPRPSNSGGASAAGAARRPRRSGGRRPRRWSGRIAWGLRVQVGNGTPRPPRSRWSRPAAGEVCGRLHPAGRGEGVRDAAAPAGPGLIGSIRAAAGTGQLFPWRLAGGGSSADLMG